MRSQPRDDEPEVELPDDAQASKVRLAEEQVQLPRCCLQAGRLAGRQRGGGERGQGSCSEGAEREIGVWEGKEGEGGGGQ